MRVGPRPRRVAACLLALAASACSRAHEPQVQVGPTAADRLARSLGIIRTAGPAHPKVLRVLFYGQSITSRKWTDLAAAHLRATYPSVRFVFANMAIGGFSAVLLERTAERDLAEFYPDLVIFHVYGDHRAYERIIRIIRSRTAAEVVVETDHVVEPVEPLCREGFHLTLQPPPGCRGRLWYRQNSWSEHMAGVVIPRLADRYGLAIEPRRRLWQTWLERTGTPAAALIHDAPHPNDAGWNLMAALFERWFDRVVASWSGQRSTLVRSLPPPRGGVAQSFTFSGNRVELLASGPVADGVQVTVDGRRPRDLDGCWQNSRTTVLPGVPDWPALRQVRIDPAFHAAERWTATITGLDPAQKHFRFALAGARTGADGGGTGDRDFVSPSGRVRIAARDWVLPDGVSLKGRRVPEGFRVSWDRHFVCTDQPPVPLAPGTSEVRAVLATGLANAPHRVTLRLTPAAAARVREIRLYRPPLTDGAEA